MGTTLFLASAIGFSLILLIVFFTKKKVKSVENRIFSIISIVNALGLIIELVLQILVLSTPVELFQNSLLITIWSKLYLIIMLLWFAIFTIYAIQISFSNNIKKTSLFCLSIFFISSLLICILPISKYYDGNIMYTYGAAVNVLKIVGVISMISWIICLLINIREIKAKKYYPIIFVVIFIFISSIIQIYKPEILLLTVIGTLSAYIMFFTIENPDIKLIEQLNEARDRADKANSAKSEFLSSMSHEIRTPLNAIVGFSNGLIENDKLDSESKDDVKNIIMASDALLELVNGILDISKIEAGKLEIIDTYYSFPKIFDELVLLTKARLGEKPLEFNYTYDKSIPEYLYGDATRVKQVILNLLTNSVKYTNTGFVNFRINSIIKGDVIRLIISVEDSGIGIKKENIDKLFGRFERLGVEKDTTVEGTGLGLAITKKLVEMMGGKIVVQSVYGKGSLFTISLDQKIVSGSELEKLKKEESAKEEGPSLFEAINKKVLVVDDNNLNLKVAKRLLDPYKCDVECVGSGFECIERIVNGEKYDLILLDDMMPKMSGKETFDKLKEVPEFNIPVVALTANAISGMKEEYLKYGFNDYLSKPIEKDELNRVMKKYLK